MVDISISSAEQKEAIEQINNGMNQLNEIAQQNVALSEELSSSSDLLFENSDKMKDTIVFFKV